MVTLTFPMTIREDALAEDEDALRLLSGVLRVDGQRIALPRVQLCGPKISAKLLPQTDNLKAGERRRCASCWSTQAWRKRMFGFPACCRRASHW
ncbi:MAG: hypothetical protein ACLUI3_06200 [Christensenellales bacterium]